MSRWPISSNRTLDIISGEPVCFCGETAEKFVTVQWGLGQTSDHPVCAEHLRQYRTDFDRLGASLRRLARKAQEEVA